MNKNYYHMILVMSALLAGLYTYHLAHVCITPDPPSKTTTQYNELWDMFEEVEENHKWELAKKDIDSLKKLGCKDIIVNYMTKGRAREAKFVSFSTVGDFEFIRLSIGGKVKNYNVDGILNRTYKVNCRR